MEHLLLNSELANNAVNSNSDEWEVIEHYLMLCARTSRLRVLQAWHVASRSSADLFEQRASGKQRLFCWLDLSVLDGTNDLQSILRRGIVVPRRGMKFVHGNLLIPGLPLITSVSAPELEEYFTLGNKRMFHFLLCEVAIGNSYPVENEAEAALCGETLPEEFDSIVIRHPSNDPLHLHDDELFSGTPSQKALKSNLTYFFPNGGPPIHENASVGVLPAFHFRHHYIVFHSAQVCPRYVVHCEVNPSSIEFFALPLCDNCSEGTAVKWCQADSASLCIECDERLHESSRLARRHMRVPLHERFQSAGFCLTHVNEETLAFCCRCKIPVCRLCRPLHRHTQQEQLGGLGTFLQAKEPANFDNDSDNSTLIPIDVAYKTYASSASIGSEAGKDFLVAANKQLDKLKEMKGGLEENFQAVEGQMHGVLDNAMNQIADLVNKKMAIVSGSQLNIQRKIEESNWEKEFLRYLLAVLPPQDYLSAWYNDKMYSLIINLLRLKHKRFQKRVNAEGKLSAEEIAQFDSHSAANLQIEGRLELRAM